ncbi:uncharacterized protein BROUX77_005435 [Berkeleyomyces rouxiae]|uniref:uncharacterized protein n=1 Tax=Berkeleyomyces rouxiae TaxID=2035830 RepID=UPI003B82760E
MDVSFDESEFALPGVPAAPRRSESRSPTRSLSSRGSPTASTQAAALAPASPSPAPTRPLNPPIFTSAARLYSTAAAASPAAPPQGSSSKLKKPRFVPSKEQQRIVELSKDHHVLVSARPGSGKTATAEAVVAGSAPGERIAILTYSKRLSLETKKRLDKYQNKCSVYTFHGMACRLFNTSLYTDAQLLAELKRLNLGEGEPPRWRQPPFDVIVLDEFQDCTPLLFWLICVFIRVNNRALGRSARLVVLGDEKQAIYEFRKADARFLTYAPDLLGSLSPGYKWATQTLSKSFRMSHQTVDFINQVYLQGEKYICGSKHGPMPIFLNAKIFNARAVAAKIFPLIRKYGAENTAILAPVIRTSRPVRELVNCLAEEFGVPISVTINDDGPLDERVIEGKLSAATVHQFKGSERDLVILLGISGNSYFTFVARDVPDDRCSNQVFVALTRAREQLVIVNEASENLMPFIDADAIPETAFWDKTSDLPYSDNVIFFGPEPGRPAQDGLALNTTTSVTNTVRFIPDEEAQSIINKYLDIRVLSPPLPEREQINIPVVIPFEWNIQKPKPNETGNVEADQFYPQENWNFHEVVSDLNGLMVVAACEHKMLKTLTTLATEQNVLHPSRIPLRDELNKQDVRWLGRTACKYESDRSNFKPRFLQMEDHPYDWITPQDLTTARNRLNEELKSSPYGSHLGFEVAVEDAKYTLDDQRTVVIGVADIVGIKAPHKKLAAAAAAADHPHQSAANLRTNETLMQRYPACLWEIKFVSQLSNEHILQTALYAHLFAVQNHRVPETILLFNVRTGEKWQISPKPNAVPSDTNTGNDGDGAAGGAVSVKPEVQMARFTEAIFRLKFTQTPHLSDDEFMLEHLMTREEAICVVDRPGKSLVCDKRKVYTDQEVVQDWGIAEGVILELEEDEGDADLGREQRNT